MKTLTLDIETSPIRSYHWKIWDENIGIEQIDQDWTIMSYAAKWLGKNRVYYADTGGRGVEHVRDDSVLMPGLWKLLDDADVVVAQNGKRFDLKKINARLIQQGYGPYSPVRVVDTLQVAKSHFGFTSNKLAWTSRILTDEPKSEHKEFPGFEMWKECLNDNPKAWAVMKKYNIKDIKATEKLYLKLRSWITNHPNVGAYVVGDMPVCRNCGGQHLQARGYAILQQGRYHRYQCQDCGAWNRGKTNLIDAGQRRSMAV
jgi:RNase_H superfamily